MRDHPGGRRGVRGVLLVAALLLAPVSAGLVTLLTASPAAATALPSFLRGDDRRPDGHPGRVLRRVGVDRPRRHRLLHLELR